MMQFRKTYPVSKFILLGLFMPVLLLSAWAPSLAQQVRNDIPELKRINVREHLGDHIPLYTTFTDDSGRTVTLGDYFNQGKPVILILAYYTCPMLCNLVMNGLSDGLKQLELLPGRDFQIVTISIDPRDPVSLAAAKRKNYLASYGKEGIDAGWRFLVGSQDQIAILADSVGFEYYYDKETEQYAHPAVVMVLTPDGRMSRYLYGITFRKNDLKLALVEASQGKIGTVFDKFLLYCYHYDPDSKGYVLFAANLMKLGGAVTLLLAAVILTVFWLKEKRRKYGQLMTLIVQVLIQRNQ
ncbi:MAG: SCO family protein [candidate division Zixibacteria bacterium]|nr:SCO family protein [candidate division Zixibacteria bacterium]